MSTRQLLVQAMVASAVAMVAIGTYDVAVRQPRTPRLAVVDVAKLYGLAQTQAARGVLQAPGASASGVALSSDAAAGALGTLMRSAEDFGPALSKVLLGLSSDCRCTLVAMAAVFGADATVPDYTAEAGRRLGFDANALASLAAGSADRWDQKEGR